jgi:hypothetical protein
VSTVDVKQVVSDDRGAVVSVQNSSRPLSGDFSKQVAVNPLQQNSAPMLGPQPIPLSQLPNSPYNNEAGNRMSMPGPSMSQPMLGQGQMMNPGMQPGMPQQPMGNQMGQPMMNNQMGQGQMMNPGLQPMGNQMGQPMMNNSPGMQPMGNQMGQNPAIMNNPMMNNSPGMQRPMSQMLSQPNMNSPGMQPMGNQMNPGMLNNSPGMPQSPMMGQPNMNNPMQSPMMSHQPMNGTYQMAPQANSPMSMMGQGQPVSGGQNYRLSQQYNQPMGQMGQGTMGQPMMPQGSMNPQMTGPMGQMGQGSMGSAPTMMGQNTMGQGMPSTNQTPSGWPPGFAPPPPPQSTGQYGNPSVYNQPYSSSPSQSPSMQHYTPSATNPFAQQVNQSPSNWSTTGSYNTANTGQYNPQQQPQNPSPYNNTGYGQQPAQYQPNPGTYGAPNNQMYNYRQ